MLKFLASPSSCETFQVRIAEQRSTRDVRTRKSAGKPNAEWLVRERIDKMKFGKSLGCLKCVSFLTGLGIKAKSTKCKSAIFICLTAFSYSANRASRNRIKSKDKFIPLIRTI